MILNWHTTKRDAVLISRIVKRASEMYPGFVRLDMHMDIAATHLNGCPLKLKELLEAPVFDFSHDVCGIVKHINRKTGKLEHCFLPRFAKPQVKGV